MSNKEQVSPQLSDAQLVMLSAATQQPKGLVAQSERTPSIARTVAMLLKRGLLVEVPVRRKDPAWRQDDTGKPIGLKITAAAREALGLTSEDSNAGSASEATPTELVATARLPTKRALVISLLERAEGAGLDDLVEATGWLPHTTRAALTGLRHSGLVLDKTKGPDGRTVYRIVAPAQQAA